jgi:hypothetical protein
MANWKAKEKKLRCYRERERPINIIHKLNIMEQKTINNGNEFVIDTKTALTEFSLFQKQW